MSKIINLTNKTYDTEFAKTYPSCDSKKNLYMSPIDINTNDVRVCNLMCQLKTYYKQNKCNIISDPSGLLTMSYDNGSYITYKSDKSSKYTLYKIMPHINAIHLINGIRHDMELHLYHKNNQGEIIVVAILVNISDNFSNSQDFFNQFVPNLKQNETNQQNYSIDVASNWNAKNVLPSLKSFYMYQGSLFYTPCEKNITWIIYENTVNINRTDYNILKEKIGHVFTIEPFSLNNSKSTTKRYVYYNNDIGTGMASKAKGKIYIKCNKIEDTNQTTTDDTTSKKKKTKATPNKTNINISTSYWETSQWISLKSLITWAIAIAVCIWFIIPALNYSFEYNKALYKIVNQPLEVQNTFGINPTDYHYNGGMNNEQLQKMVTKFVSQTTNAKFDLSTDTWFNEYPMRLMHFFGRGAYQIVHPGTTNN
jgi:carbonic anhydrase